MTDYKDLVSTASAEQRATLDRLETACIQSTGSPWQYQDQNATWEWRLVRQHPDGGIGGSYQRVDGSGSKGSFKLKADGRIERGSLWLRRRAVAEEPRVVLRLPEGTDPQSVSGKLQQFLDDEGILGSVET